MAKQNYSRTSGNHNHANIIYEPTQANFIARQLSKEKRPNPVYNDKPKYAERITLRRFSWEEK